MDKISTVRWIDQFNFYATAGGWFPWLRTSANGLRPIGQRQTIPPPSSAELIQQLAADDLEGYPAGAVFMPLTGEH